MFGDDPDPSVTTARFGFGAIFGRTQEGFWQNAMETRVFDGLRKEREESGPVDLRGVNRDKEEAATTSKCKFYENDADENANDDMRWNAWHEQNAKRKTKLNHEGKNHNT